MRKKIVSILVIILFVLTIIVKIGASKNINNVTCTTESNKQQTMTEETDDVIEKTVTSDDNVPDISPLETAQSKDSQVNGKLKNHSCNLYATLCGRFCRKIFFRHTLTHADIYHVYCI